MSLTFDFFLEKSARIQYTYIEVIITAEFMENNQILICPDSFKGTLTAEEVADTIEKAIKDVSPAANTRVLPIADGGEDTPALCKRSVRMEKRVA